MIRLRISSDIFRSGYFFYGSKKKLWGKKNTGPTGRYFTITITNSFLKFITDAAT
jgi:hypothetical protein